MADVNLELLGKLVEQLLEGQRRIEARMDQLATRELVTRLWRLTEDRGALLRTELVDADGGLERRLDELEDKVASLQSAVDSLSRER
jgi:uncharacterized coiled-coil protein SlyX